MALRGLAALPFSRPDSDRACANCADSIDPSRYQSQGEDRRSVRADEWPLLSFTLHRSDLEVIVQDPLIIAGKAYHSRLLTGTGKFKDLEETRLATEAAGAQIVTVAIRRSNIGQNPGEPNLLDVLPPDRYTLLPNTAGCYTADDAVRTCRLARELLDGHKLVKLEVLGDPRTLFPDVVQTLVAAEILVKDGFDVMVYTSDDPILARRLEEIGCVAVMPLAAPIGSGLGVQNRYNLLEIVENAKVPILVDAGVGTASDAAVAMELGCDGVLMNTAIAGAKLPVLMAGAMRKAVEAGREAFLAGRIPRKRYASASSPVDGLVG
jgi:thiazole synthase